MLYDFGEGDERMVRQWNKETGRWGKRGSGSFCTETRCRVRCDGCRWGGVTHSDGPSERCIVTPCSSEQALRNLKTKEPNFAV